MQKRLVLCLLSLMMIFGVFVGAPTAQAVSVDDLTDTAQYFPHDTIFYAAIRTDDGYIDALNDLIALFDSNTGGLLELPDIINIPPFPELIDAALFGGYLAFTDLNWDWFGDTLGVGLLLDLPADEAVFYLALAITDADALAADFEALDVEVAEAGDYRAVSGRFAIGFDAVITDDVVLIGEDLLALEAALKLDSTLADNDTFTTTRDLLPEESYNIFAYVDVALIIETLADLLTMDPTVDPMNADMFYDFTDDSGSVAFGATILDGRTLTLDIASLPTDSDSVVAHPAFYEQTPVDTAFAQYLPAHTQMLIHDANLADDFAGFIAALDQIGPALQDTINLLAVAEVCVNGECEPVDDPINRLDLTQINFGGLLKHTITPVFAGFTGLNLEREVFSWMTEDYTLAFSLLPLESDLGLTLDIAMLAAVSDADAARNVVDKLIRADGLYRLGGVVEDGSLVYPDFIPSILASADVPVFLLDDPALDIVIGANDEVFTFGSRPSADFALNPSGDSLADNAVYQYATTLFVEDAVSVLYMDTAGIAASLPALAVLDVTDDEIALLQFLFGQFESMTISQNQNDDASSVLRLTMTLAEDVTYEFPVVEFMSFFFPVPQLGGSTGSMISFEYAASLTRQGISGTADGARVAGDPDAPVTLVLFTDFMCPSCIDYHFTVREFIAEQVAGGAIQFEVRPHPLRGEDSVFLAGLVECAGELRGDYNYWLAYDLIFGDTRAGLDPGGVVFWVGTNIGVDSVELRECAENAEQYLVTQALAATADVTGTPAIRVRYNGGDLEVIESYFSGGVPISVLQELIANAGD